MDVQQPRRRRLGAIRVSALAAVTALLAGGCSAEAQRGWLPGQQNGEWVTNETQRITQLWTGSWIAALAVGVIVWGLIIWCVTVYRKRKDDETLPIQFRYHVPLEIMYVILPLLMIGVLYYYTERDTSAIQDISEEPDLVVEVIGKQWSWDFNYIEDGVYETGVHLLEPGDVVDEDLVPTLYLPVDERVEFRLESRDVIHAFWVPAFLYKQDVFPGRTNVFQLVPTEVGTYAGKCTEFCGEYHAGMLFNVAVVPREEYDAEMERLRELGQEGRLGTELSRVQNRGDDGAIPTGEG